jgi:hypothetical protein
MSNILFSKYFRSVSLLRQMSPIIAKDSASRRELLCAWLIYHVIALIFWRESIPSVISAIYTMWLADVLVYQQTSAH